MKRGEVRGVAAGDAVAATFLERARERRAHVSAERNATICRHENVLRSPVRASPGGEPDRWSGRRAVT
jgi:hypothetical protein